MSGKLWQRGEKPAWFERQFTVQWRSHGKPKAWSFHCHRPMTKGCSRAPPRRLANRFLEVLPRGPRGSVYLSIYLPYLSIYLSAIQFIHLIPINECYIYIYLSTYCRPIESYCKYYYPRIPMISQLRGLQGARSADDESTKSAGKRAARAGDLLVV